MNSLLKICLIGLMLIPVPLFTQNKLQIAVLNLETLGLEETTAIALSERLRSELVATGAYRVIERNQMNTILREQGFQQSGCTSDACAVEIGKILNINRICAGSVARVGSIFTVSLRLIDVSTGEIVISVTEDCDCPIETLLTETMKKLALQLAGDTLPPPPSREGTLQIINPLTGTVVSLNGMMLTLDKDSLVVPSGKHRLTARKPGFEGFSSQFKIRPGEHLRIDLHLKPKTRPKALFRSLFLPGLGQHYQEKSLSGFMFNLFFVGSAGAAVLLDKQMTDKSDEYENLRESYTEAYSLSEIEQARKLMTERYDDIENLELQRNLAIGAAGVVWAWSMLDCWFRKPVYERKSALDLETRQDRTTLHFKYCF